MVNAVCFPSDYPVFEMGKVVTKEEEIAYLDDLGLFADCRYCRTPKAGRPCGQCATCREVKLARRTISKRRTNRVRARSQT